MNLEKNTVVTVELDNNASNTFIVDTDEGSTVLVRHPLAAGVLMRVSKEIINKLASKNLQKSKRKSRKN